MLRRYTIKPTPRIRAVAPPEYVVVEAEEMSDFEDIRAEEDEKFEFIEPEREAWWTSPPRSSSQPPPPPPPAAAPRLRSAMKRVEPPPLPAFDPAAGSLWRPESGKEEADSATREPDDDNDGWRYYCWGNIEVPDAWLSSSMEARAGDEEEEQEEENDDDDDNDEDDDEIHDGRAAGRRPHDATRVQARSFDEMHEQLAGLNLGGTPPRDIIDQIEIQRQQQQQQQAHVRTLAHRRQCVWPWKVQHHARQAQLSMEMQEARLRKMPPWPVPADGLEPFPGGAQAAEEAERRGAERACEEAVGQEHRAARYWRNNKVSRTPERFWDQM